MRIFLISFLFSFLIQAYPLEQQICPVAKKMAESVSQNMEKYWECNKNLVENLLTEKLVNPLCPEDLKQQVGYYEACLIAVMAIEKMAIWKLEESFECNPEKIDISLVERVCLYFK